MYILYLDCCTKSPIIAAQPHNGPVELIGPLTFTPRGNQYIIVATDYFSKWPEDAPGIAKQRSYNSGTLYELIVLTIWSIKHYH